MVSTKIGLKKFFLLFFCLLTLIVNGQRADLKVLTSLPDRFNSGVIRFAGIQSGDLTGFHLTSNQVEFISIDTATNEFKSFTNFPKFLKEINIHQVRSYQDSIFIYGIHKAKLAFHLIQANFHKDDAINIRFDTLYTIEQESSFQQLQFKWAGSNDKSCFQFYFLREDKKFDYIHCISFMPNTIIEHEAIQVAKLEDWDGVKFKVMNNGNFIICIPRIDESHLSGSAYHLHTNIKPEAISLQFNQSNPVYELEIYPVDTNSVIITGIQQLSKQKKANDGNPVFISRFDFSTHKVSTPKFIKKHGEKFPLKSSYYNILHPRQVIPLTDGGFIWVGEQYEKIARSRSFGSLSGFERTNISDLTISYYYNDIILVRYNQFFEPMWVRTIYKNQISTNDQGIYSSFYIKRFENVLQFLFNESISKKENIVAVNVFKNGGTQKVELEGTNEGDQIMFRFGNEIDYLETILPAEGRKRNSLYIISY